MGELLFGFENEYAFTALGTSGKVLNREVLLFKFNALAKGMLIHLPDFREQSMFLANGGRLYLDCGLHEEWATPEVTNPFDVVRYLLAGERIMLNVAAELCAQEKQIAEAFFYKCNVDYSGTRSCWGAHESVMHTSPQAQLQPQVLPHLVSRIIYTGAGGFDPLSPGCEFTLSPRVAHLQRDTSTESTHDRGIWHTKEESHCGDKYHRLHILCGDSLCSHRGNFLKAGTTALVVAMADAGLCPGAAVAPASPLTAMRAFAADPACRVEVAARNGSRLTALAIQRHYLTMARAHVHDEFMPPWAPRVIEAWQAALDSLGAGIDAVATSLDWAIKLRLFQRFASRRGMAWETLAEWNRVFLTLRKTLDGAKDSQAITLALVQQPDGPLAIAVKELALPMRARGMEWPAMEKALQIRLELFELDTRFGQLGDRGLFASMDLAGMLQHRVPGIDNIEHAMEHPPALGRAHLRGQLIRRHAGTGNHFHCDWSVISDYDTGRGLDMSNPWIQIESWLDNEQAGLQIEQSAAIRVLRNISARRTIQSR